MSFRIGQKVVCINAENFCGGTWTPGYELIKGEIYTITHLGLLIGSGRPGCNIAELPPHPRHECRFGIFRFRPLVDRKTDISIFTRMLDGVRDKETISN